MGFKNKVFGFVAAAGLTLSLIAGVSAAPSSGSVSGQVELKEGLCGITLSSSNGDFGDFTYNGIAYDRTAGNNETFISGTLYAAKPNGKCNVTVSTDGLFGTSGTIPTTHFSWNYDGSAFNPVGSIGLPAAGTISNVPAGSGTLGLRLDSVPSTFAPGVYNGTLDVQVTNGA